MVYKGENELMETKEMWKTYSHVAEFFERPLVVKERPLAPNAILPADQSDRKLKERQYVEAVVQFYEPEYDVSTITDEQVDSWLLAAAWLEKVFSETSGPQELFYVDKNDFQL